MSALDQAFIRAYAKESPAAATAAEPRAPREPAPAEPRADYPAQPCDEVERLYDDAAFYRVDAASASARPHFAPAERKVPRRLQRRGAVARELEPEETPPPAVEAPPRREIRRPQNSLRSLIRYLATVDVPELPLQAELSPAAPVDPPPHLPSPGGEPKTPGADQPAPFTQNSQAPPIASWNAVSVQGHWDAAPGEPITPPVMFIHTNTPRGAAQTITVDIRLPAAPAIDPSSGERSRREARRFRLDNAHSAISPHRPKPAAKQQPEAPPSPQPTAPPPVAESIAAPPVAVAPAPVDPTPPPVVAAAPPVVAAPVPTPVAPPPSVALPPPVPEAASDKQRCVPLWEVDSFTWPVACEKLFRNETGLFHGMSDKLRGVVAGGVKTLAVSGSRRGEGRTTLALCLARAAAEAGISVALVDADFSRPQAASSLGLEVAYGWHEAAQGKVPLSEAAIRSLKDRVTVLPLDAAAATAGLSWNDPRVTATLRSISAAFDLTIIDLGPLPSDARPLFPEGEKCPFDGALSGIPIPIR
jgi:Mrp family chromosome partitioning ATPase